MNDKIKAIFFTLTVLSSAPACSAQSQAVGGLDANKPMTAEQAYRGLDYAPEPRSVDEVAIPVVEVIRLAQVSDANIFNVNLKKPRDKNLPPSEDGIHDPANEATHVLQPPKEAYKGLPSAEAGNYVDWVKALDEGKLKPRWDRIDPDEEPFVMDLDIVRPVKASVPDVVFPHRQHTEWLYCSNCHPAIFIPQKGANQINMSAILLGQKCGVCHGKVSFPITTLTCRKCHSKPKPDDWKPPLSEATLKNPWK